MTKHLLLEIEVSDKGQKTPIEVTSLIEDMLANHIYDCANGSVESEMFGTRSPRIRVLTEENPI